MQSASVMHMSLQVVPPQTYCPQPVTVASWQVPLPSQVRPLVCVPPMQDGSLPHFVPDAICSHFCLFVQFPVLPQSPFDMHMLCGSGLPAATLVHVPGLEPLQVWQSPHDVVLQQTPSTHVPVAHGAPAEQWSPNPPPLVHVPPMQKEPAAQSAACVATVHEVLQPEVVQAKLPQGTGVVEGQVVVVPEHIAAGEYPDAPQVAALH